MQAGGKGPAKLIDNTNISRGTVTVRHERDFPSEIRLQDVRRHLEYLVLLAARGSLQEVGAVGWDDVRAALDRLPLGKTPLGHGAVFAGMAPSQQLHLHEPHVSHA